MFKRRTLLYGVAALALFALVVSAGKGGGGKPPKDPPDPEPPADPAILYLWSSTTTKSAEDFWEIRVMNYDGTNRTSIITPATHGLYPGPAVRQQPALRWSRDNTRFLFKASTVSVGDWGDLYVSDADGSNVKRVFDADGVSFDMVHSFDWSPAPFPGQPAGDEWIILTLGAVYEEHYDLYAIRSDGTGLVQLTDTAEYSEQLPEVTPDGRYVLFRRHDQIGNTSAYLSRVIKATLGTDAASSLPTITAEECITEFPGGPLEGKHCNFIGIDPTGTYALVDDGDANRPRWLVPLADPTEAWNTVLGHITGAWLDPETLIYSFQSSKDESFFATVNVFTGEEAILASFGRKPRYAVGPSPLRWIDTP